VLVTFAAAGVAAALKNRNTVSSDGVYVPLVKHSVAEKAVHVGVE